MAWQRQGSQEDNTTKNSYKQPQRRSQLASLTDQTMDSMATASPRVMLQIIHQCSTPSHHAVLQCYTEMAE